MAILGGSVLTLLILIVCASVLGRVMNGVLHGPIEVISPAVSKFFLDLGVGPINGDFELVEAGVAFAIFAFLPLCQLTGGHATVDVFAAAFPRKLNRFLAVLFELAFAAVLILIAVQLFDGMMSKRRYGETTFLLQFPIWWAYAASLFGAVVAALVGVYVAALRVMRTFTGDADEDDIETVEIDS